MWTLKERRETWTVKRLFMGDDNICHSGGLVGEKRAQHIIFFGEDESGKRISTEVDIHIHNI